MDFQGHTQLHSLLRDELWAALEAQGQIDVARFQSDQACDLGCWLAGPGRVRWAGNHAFLNLQDAHRAFHARAGDIAALIHRGEVQQARRALRNGSPFAVAFSDLAVAFKRLQQVQRTAA